jgi:hypothetical protein
MDQKSSTDNSLSMDTSTSTAGIKSENNDTISTNINIKRKHINNESSSATKRSKLNDMIFYDGNRHPAAVLHDLRPEISTDKYDFQSEEIAPKQKRFRCSVTIDQNVLEPITAIGVGRSKQLAKNMAAQVKYSSSSKYLGQSKSSVVTILFPYRKLKEIFFFHIVIEKRMLYFSMLFDHTSTNIIIIKFR